MIHYELAWSNMNIYELTWYLGKATGGPTNGTGGGDPRITLEHMREAAETQRKQGEVTRNRFQSIRNDLQRWISMV